MMPPPVVEDADDDSRESEVGESPEMTPEGRAGTEEAQEDATGGDVTPMGLVLSDLDSIVVADDGVVVSDAPLDASVALPLPPPPPAFAYLLVISFACNSNAILFSLNCFVTSACNPSSEFGSLNNC